MTDGAGQVNTQASRRGSRRVPRPARLLMVQDERMRAFDLCTRLTRMGHTVIGTGASGREATAPVEALRADLVLMDIRLQGPMDGSETAAMIRTPLDLPGVYLRASVDAITLTRANATHPAGVLHKPVSDEDRQHTLARTLREGPPAVL